MTAVDVDALDKLREAATAGPWSTDGDGVVMARFIAGDLPPLREPIAEAHRPDAALIVAAVNALPDLLAEVRRGRALREAVEGLAEELERESADAADRARALPRTEENVRHHTAERRHARVASHTASALRAVVATVDGEQ